MTIVQSKQSNHVDIEVVIYTDGACRGNPGPGGWGAILRGQGKFAGKSKRIFGGELDTTNNRMELLAAIKSLQVLNRPTRVALFTDSRYVQQGINEWIANWKKRGWRGANKKIVKNKDLWQALDEARERHQVEWHWVKGHAGIRDNEIADELANQGIDDLLAQQVSASGISEEE